MRMEVNREYRLIRVWTSLEHAYVLSFKHPKYQKWWVCLAEEWWHKPRHKQLNIEFARVIWAR